MVKHKIDDCYNYVIAIVIVIVIVIVYNPRSFFNVTISKEELYE